ncbi:MAG: NAD-dependent epimerase/dehydratase family protein [Deltaproteobacteria bacterium]|nr:NAD-dependent epimerase/dehydratase family protein [Deltaproteobacteria bacterium]
MRVLITGGYGFLGRALYKEFFIEGFEPVRFRSSRWNLCNFDEALDVVGFYKPDVVVHSAARYGGLGINFEIPEEIFYYNTLMNANIVRASAMKKVKLFVGVGTACSYPGYLKGTLREKDFWRGAVHDSVSCYGSVKKMMVVHCAAAKKEYGMEFIHPVLANLYGPHDSFAPRRSHVVAALLLKFLEAKKGLTDSVTVWGSGKPKREFLFVEDAAEAIVHLVKEGVGKGEVINIGTGVATSIKRLVEMIKEVSGFDGKVVWDTSKPDGQAKKVFDIGKLKAVVGWVPEPISFDKLKRTYDWLEANYENVIIKDW